jgi:hypothetical protein
MPGTPGIANMPPLSMDGIRRHEYILQILAPVRWQDGTALSSIFNTPIKMIGFCQFSRATVAPSNFDIYTDQITGKKYILIDTYCLMEITGGGN